MNKFLSLVLAVVAGFAIGSAVNFGLIMLGGKLIAPPAGADVSTMEGLRTSLHLFEPRHFVFPFLAHALGTLAGATTACLLSTRRTAGPAYTVGLLFLLGGIANVIMLPAPMWFNATDLVLAYLPFAWLGQRIAQGHTQRTASGV